MQARSLCKNYTGKLIGGVPSKPDKNQDVDATDGKRRGSKINPQLKTMIEVITDGSKMIVSRNVDGEILLQICWITLGSDETADWLGIELVDHGECHSFYQERNTRAVRQPTVDHIASGVLHSRQKGSKQNWQRAVRHDKDN